MDCCVYCGDWYQCRDHVIPISYCQVYRDYKPGATVRACRECNGLLGSKAYFTQEERAEYLLARYPIKYRKLLQMPHWTPEECADLGYNLRVTVEAKMVLREIYALKIDNLERTSLALPAIPINELDFSFVDRSLGERCCK